MDLSLENQKAQTEQKKVPIWLLGFSYLIRLVLVVVILGGSTYFARHLMKTKPKAKRKRPKYQVFVKTALLAMIDHQTKIETMGTVIPSRQIDLSAQVSGKILRVGPSLIPGGFFRRGELLLKIDPVDEKRNVARAKVALDSSKIKLERARQDLAIAKKNLPLSRKKADATQKRAQADFLEAEAKFHRVGKLAKENLSSQEDYDAAKATSIQKMTELDNAKISLEALEIEEMNLVLKRKDVRLAEKQVKQDKIALKEAKKRLDDTNVVAPFDCIVLQRYVSRGSIITTSTKLATLVATNNYWVEVSIPQDRLSWLSIPKNIEQQGSQTKIFHRAWKKNISRTGYVKRLLPSIEEEGRMARLLIEVNDPMNRELEDSKRPLLLLGAFMHICIDGKILRNVIKIPREYLRDGDYVWIFNHGKLRRSSVNIVWREKQHVYVDKGVNADEKIVVTDVPGAVSGMKVKGVRQ